MHFSNKAKYPWMLFARVFLIQIVAYNLLFVGFLVFWEVIRGGVREFYPIGFIYIFGTFFISSLLSHLVSRPVARIVHKAHFLSSKRLARELGPVDDDLLVSEFGEFAEIENALNKIDRKIRKSKDSFNREKEEIQALMGSVEDGLVSFALDGKLMFFNSHFARLFLKADRIRTEESIYITNIFRAPELFDAFEKVKNGGHPIKITLYLEDLQNSFSHFYAVTLAPLRKIEDASIYGVTSAFHDITEIKRAEQIRIDFIGNASHELRTPITTIKGYAETILEDLQRGSLDGDTKKFLEIILRNADRLTSLVEDMMEIHSLENDPDLNFEEVSVRDITQQVIGDLAVIADSKKQIVDLKCEGIDLINVDKLKLEQVLKNLIGNAIKYSDVKSQVKVIWSSEDNGNCILRVIDNGPGIPEHHLARLFERFYRVDRGRSRDQGGTGLGLAIVKHIMQTHGGSVTVKSTLGVGSEFICTFPSELSVSRT